jgi:hypothetical protein
MLREFVCREGRDIRARHEQAHAKEMADVVAGLKRLTSERDSWKLRAESGEHTVKAVCRQGE